MYLKNLKFDQVVLFEISKNKLYIQNLRVQNNHIISDC